ncbi:Fc.00g088090.m01.CDS01 [Cosmosporella sp. VM-42]
MTASTPPRTGPGIHSGSPDTTDSARTLSSSVQHKAARLRAPRSLPPWIDSYEEKHGAVGDDQLRLLHPPIRSVQPQHNSTPSDPQRRVSKDGFVDLNDPLAGQAKAEGGRIPHILRYGRASMRGRRWDHLRSAEPVIVPGHKPTPYKTAATQPTTTWQDFVHSSAWGHMPNEEAHVVDVETLNKLQPTFNRPIASPYNPNETRAPLRRRTLAPYKRIWNMILRHSLAPLLFRLVVMITSILALGISARIHELEDVDSTGTAEETQSIVAVVVDCVAIPYIGYMIWDEYTGKPLGLRSVVSKISLILLDLFFIIFKSASTALAFESLVYHNLTDHRVKNLSKALAAFMLIGLMAWTMNFAVNIFRTVERLGGGEDDGAHG